MIEKTKRSRKGIKCPVYAVMFSYNDRTIVWKTFSYGRNGDYQSSVALAKAKVFVKEFNPNLGVCWIERGWVILRLPRKKVK
jgi:hypothetical protein